MKTQLIYQGTKEELINEFESKVFSSTWKEMYHDYDEYPQAKIEIATCLIKDQIESMYEHIKKKGILPVGKVFYMQHIPQAKRHVEFIHFKIVGEYVAFTDINYMEKLKK